MTEANVFGRLLASRKGTIALLALGISSVALFLGKVDGGSFVSIVQVTVGTFTVSTAIEDGAAKLRRGRP